MSKYPVPIIDLNIETEIVSERLFAALCIATVAVLIALIAVVAFAYQEIETSKDSQEIHFTTHH